MQFFTATHSAIEEKYISSQVYGIYNSSSSDTYYFSREMWQEEFSSLALIQIKAEEMENVVVSIFLFKEIWKIFYE